MKFLVGKLKFDPSDISFGGYMIVNTLIVIGGIFYWTFVEFDWKVFVIGFFGSIINNLGIVAINHAFSCGPAGPIAALSSTSTIMLTIVMALINWAVPTPLELAGLVVGLLGALVLTIPDQIAYLFTCCCKKKGIKYDEFK